MTLDSTTNHPSNSFCPIYHQYRVSTTHAPSLHKRVAIKLCLQRDRDMGNPPRLVANCFITHGSNDFHFTSSYIQPPLTSTLRSFLWLESTLQLLQVPGINTVTLGFPKFANVKYSPDQGKLPCHSATLLVVLFLRASPQPTAVSI